MIELLVVLATIGVLVALLVPAVSAARETGRRAQCQNNLRQLGLALHAYHDVTLTFPPGGIEWRPPGPAFVNYKNFAWSALILPHLEQRALHDAINFSLPFDHKANSTSATRIVSVFLCPSSLRTRIALGDLGGCDYAGLSGETITTSKNAIAGMLTYAGSVQLRDVRDGTANTLIVAESTRWSDGEWINAYNVLVQSFPIKGLPKGIKDNEIESEHPAGACALAVDGSVRLLTFSTPPRILAAYLTRAGDERFDDPF